MVMTKFSEENNIKLDNNNSHVLNLLSSSIIEIQNHIHKRYQDEKHRKRIKEFFNFNNMNLISKLNQLIMNADLIKEINDIYLYNIFHKWRSTGILSLIIFKYQIFDKVYDMLADEFSRKVFDWLICYNIGYSFLGNNTNEVFPHSAIGSENIKNNTYSPKKKGVLYEIESYLIYSEEKLIQETWQENLYCLTGKCEPQLGDTVISGGACFGETSIWFADKVGQNGRVYAFEPSKHNCTRVEENIKRNRLESIIRINNYGLWDKETKLFFNSVDSNGPGSFCSDNQGEYAINAVSIDGFLEKEGLAKIDFIKLDVEGAELKTMEGARNVITNYKPNLAISLYHLPSDILEIPILIKSLVPEYNIYLSHKMNRLGQTVLFASMK